MPPHKKIQIQIVKKPVEKPKVKLGRPKKVEMVERKARTPEYPMEDLMAAAKKCRGIVSEMAEELGCSIPLINKRRRESPELRQVIKEERMRLRGKVSRNISEAIYDEDNPEQQLEISKWAAKCKFMEGSDFEPIEKKVLSNDPKNPIPQANTSVNVINVNDLPLEVRKLIYEQAKKYAEQKQLAKDGVPALEQSETIDPGKPQ